MVSHRACDILRWLRGNVINGLETMREARAFVRRLKGLTENERLFLECALTNRAEMEEFHTTFASRRI